MWGCHGRPKSIRPSTASLCCRRRRLQRRGSENPNNTVEFSAFHTRIRKRHARHARAHRDCLHPRANRDGRRKPDAPAPGPRRSKVPEYCGSWRYDDRKSAACQFKASHYDVLGKMGWLRGLEPPASWTTTRRSNQLSYSHHQMRDCVVGARSAVKIRAPNFPKPSDRRRRTVDHPS